MVARKTSTAPTRVWMFGARVAVESVAIVRDLAWRSNRYYNTMVEIERRRHARFVAIRRQHAPELAALEDEWERLDDEVAELLRATRGSRQEHWRSSGEKRRLLPGDVDARLRALDAAKRAASAAAKDHRVAFAALCDAPRAEYKRRATERADDGGPVIKGKSNAAVLTEMLNESEWHDAWKQIAISDRDAHAEMIAARAACSLPTGTYLQVEAAFQRARVDSAPRPPRFRRADDRVKLAIQMRARVTWSQLLLGSDARASVTRAPYDPRKQGNQSRMHVVRIDQSIPRSKRQSVDLVVKLHRQPPPNAVVKWVSIVGRRVGRRDVYEVQFTLEHPSFSDAKRPSGSRAPEHISIGWSAVDGGVRVARWSDGEVTVPNTILRQDSYAAAVRGTADALYHRALRLLRRWMRGGPHRLAAWHRMGRDRDRNQLRRVCGEYADFVLGDAHAVWKAWRTERLSRGEDLYAPTWLVRRWLRGALCRSEGSQGRGMTEQAQVAAFWLYAWARKDAHLCQLARDSKRRFEARRDAHYRQAAIRIATEFESVTVDRYSIASMKELPALTRPGDPPRDRAQHNAQAAAPGRFREILREAMGPRCTPCGRSGGESDAGTARKRKGKGSREGAVTVGDDAAAGEE